MRMIVREWNAEKDYQQKRGQKNMLNVFDDHGFTLYFTVLIKRKLV
ncbi:MAG: hypothetical protein JXL67_02835 [Calditrichaeota bacterium]|nr:hypothetical protein [Calditrichota bacterium]